MLSLGCPVWTRISFTLSWKPQFDLGGHPWDVKSTIHNRNSQRKENNFPETSRQQHNPKQKYNNRPLMFLFLNLLYHKLTQSALRLLLWVVSRTRKHTSFTRRGSHCRRVHALLTPFTLHMCACLSTRAQLLCMFIYVTESGHNLGRTNNYFIMVI